MAPRPTLVRERAAWADSCLLVGIDEVGRCPLASPVVAVGVVFPPGTKAVRGLRDSKILPAGRREQLSIVIRRRAIRVTLGAASVREIDRYNIRVATAIAMRRALERALPGLSSYRIIIDGLPLREIGHDHEALVDGDAHCHSIAAAGVVAKTVRDRLMRRLALRHPGYGWTTNAGYGTPEHHDGLNRLGPCCHHRQTFAPIAQLAIW